MKDESLLEYIENQLEMYRRKNAEFEIRDMQSFDLFSNSLRNCAAPKEDGDWMHWESGRCFLSKWQQIYEQVGAK